MAAEGVRKFTARVDIIRSGEKGPLKRWGRMEYNYSVWSRLTPEMLDDFSLKPGLVGHGEIPGLAEVKVGRNFTDVKLFREELAEGTFITTGGPHKRQENIKWREQIDAVGIIAIALNRVGEYVEWQAEGRHDDFEVRVVNLKNRMPSRYPEKCSLGSRIDPLKFFWLNEVRRLESWIGWDPEFVRQEIGKLREEEVEKTIKVLEVLKDSLGKGETLENIAFSGLFDESCFLASANRSVNPRRTSLAQIEAGILLESEKRKKDK